MENLYLSASGARGFFSRVRGSARGPEEQDSGFGGGSEHKPWGVWTHPPQLTLLLTSRPSLGMFRCRIWVQSHLRISHVCPIAETWRRAEGLERTPLREHVALIS